MRKFAIAVLSAMLAACGPSLDEINTQVQQSMQTKFDEPDMAQYHLKVAGVKVIHDEGNKYEGMADVEMSGQSHQVPVHVVADGKSLIWRTDQGAMMFVVQETIKKAMADIASPPPAAIPPAIQQLIAAESTDNESCRGGSEDDPKTAASCERRDAEYAQIKSLGWCWGHKDQIDADRNWVRCSAGD
jgi:hypothetical protein